MTNQIVRRIAQRAAVKYGSVAAFLGALGVNAHAALPTGVTTAIEAAGTDMVTAITAIIVAFVAFWGLKKLGSKLGWI
ncbi:MAG: hypothetical protein C0445_00295 [Polaromonas sp.]|nr:hypothetical protein [Polaromonas sp.]